MNANAGKKVLVYGPAVVAIVLLVVSGTLEWMSWPMVLVVAVVLGGMTAMAQSVLRDL